MPFDNPRVDTLTLTDLAWRLRNPETWPEGFRWNYRNCPTCAMGLAFSLVGSKRWEDYDVASRRLRRLGGEFEKIADDEFNAIFRGVARQLRVQLEDVTPNQVADAIDDFLAKQGD